MIIAFVASILYGLAVVMEKLILQNNHPFCLIFYFSLISIICSVVIIIIYP